MKILDKIESPEDVKQLNIKELNILTDELREALITYLSKHGGHIGPNLGVVELEVALHYVFNSPVDKIVYDVSHQCYVHKILTGRKYAFTEEEHFGEVTGFSEPTESEHDFFRMGHTSTSISLLNGLQRARDIKGDKENVIAVIGDGSLSGGEAYEGLNNVSEAGTNAIIIVNDNEMSISENHGGLYKNLKELRESNGKCENNFFKALGFSYFYLEEGNDVEALIGILSKLKDTKEPTVLHIHTLKGKGLSYVIENEEKYHSGGPFNRENGEYLSKDSEDYIPLTVDYLTNKIKQGKNIAIVVSGTPSYFFKKKEDRDMLSNHFIDVGIAEEHAAAMISGMARNKVKPVYMVASSFLQRAFDQVSQDLSMNNNPAVILTFWASIYGMNSATHLGFFDIPLLSNIPNLVYLAPTSKEEYIGMLKWAIKEKDKSVAIRVPANKMISIGKLDNTDYSILNKSKVVKEGRDVAILAVGSFFSRGEKIAKKLKDDLNINATLINPVFLTGLDKDLLDKISKNHKLVITLEDGIIEGGFGQKVASFYGKYDIRVLNFGIKKKFYNGYKVDEILKDNNLNIDTIVKEVKRYVEFL